MFTCCYCSKEVEKVTCICTCNNSFVCVKAKHCLYLVTCALIYFRTNLSQSCCFGNGKWRYVENTETVAWPGALGWWPSVTGTCSKVAKSFFFPLLHVVNLLAGIGFESFTLYEAFWESLQKITFLKMFFVLSLFRLYEKFGETALRPLIKFHPSISPSDIKQLCWNDPAHFLAYLDSLLKSQPEDKR